MTLTPTTYMTLSDIAKALRYDGPNAQENCREWLRRREIRPSLKRGLFRRDLIERAIAREEAANVHPRRRKASLQPVSSRRVKRDRSLEGADVSVEDVGVRHAEKVDDAGSIEQCHSVVGAR